MKNKILLESGVQSDIQCDYCNFDEALDDYESRADYKPRDFKYKGGYHNHRYCPLCGWTEFENYREADNETPDDPYVEYIPNQKQIANANEIVKFLHKARDEDNAYEAIYEYVWSGHDPEKENIEDLKRGVFDFIFTRTE